MCPVVGDMIHESSISWISWISLFFQLGNGRPTSYPYVKLGVIPMTHSILIPCFFSLLNCFNSCLTLQFRTSFQKMFESIKLLASEIAPRRQNVTGRVSSDQHENPTSAKENSLRSGSGDGSTEERKPKHASFVIFCLSCITFVSCYLGGLVTVSVPQISRDLELTQGMELWYCDPLQHAS